MVALTVFSELSKEMKEEEEEEKRSCEVESEEREAYGGVGGQNWS